MNVFGVPRSEPSSLNSSPSRGVKRSLSDESDLSAKRQQTPHNSPERLTASLVSPLAQRVLKFNFDSTQDSTSSTHLIRTILDDEMPHVETASKELPCLTSLFDEEMKMARIQSIIDTPIAFFAKMDSLLSGENFSVNEGINALNDYYDALSEIQDASLDESYFLCPHAILTLCRLHHHVMTYLSYARSGAEDVDEKFRKNLALICCLLESSKEQAKDLHKLLVTEELSNDPSCAVLRQFLLEKKYLSLNDKPLILYSEQQILNHVLKRVKEAIKEGTEEKILLVKVHRLALHLLELVRRGQHVGVYSLFHAVKNIQNISPILQNKILVKHEQKYAGAFVSTRHERGIGDCAVVVSAQTVTAKKLCRIERRSEEEGGGIWIGSNDPLTPDRTRIVHQPLTPNTYAALKRSLPEGCILVESAVQERFGEYVRELSDVIPVPSGTKFSDIAPWHESRESDADINDSSFA